MATINTAIILAGGKGERLRPFTNDRPKPMVEVLGKPIVFYQIEQLRKSGVEQIIFACSYHHEFLQKKIGDGKKLGVKAFYSVENEPLGRGGGIKKAMKKITGQWSDVLVINGDTLFKADFPSMVKKHQNKGALATIMVVPLKSPYGIVEFNKYDQVLGFREKPVLPHWINAGLYIFSKEIMELLPDVGDHETETFPMLPSDKFYVFPSTNYWRGIDTVKDLTEAEKEVKEAFRQM